jgi:outer membrane protein assembly factor BamA
MQKDPLIESAYSNEEMGSSDSLRMYRNLSYDDKPITIETIPEIKPYKTKFSLDTLWGGLAYSSYAGTVGYLELSLSDIMGNHGIGISLSAAGKLKDSNLLISYLYLKQRMDYGIGLFNLNDQIHIQMSIPGPQNDLYIRYKQRQTGLYLLLRYPFNRFTRIELENMFYQQEYYLSYWDWNIGDWTEEENLGSDKVFSPAVNLVHDNALYGPTGPLAGRRLYYSVGTSLRDNNLDYLTNYLDWRNYILFSKRYSLATRLITGISVGDYPQRFALGGYYGIRAYDGNLSGEKKAVFCTELRFPFFENINIAFPLPLNIPNVRGSLFAEIGTVFDDFNKFQATHEGKLKDLYLGYGFGPRINLGIFILSLDITWLTDLSHISKPTYYLSLSEDF